MKNVESLWEKYIAFFCELPKMVSAPTKNNEDMDNDLTVSDMLRSVCFIAQTTESTTSFWCSGGILKRAGKQCELIAWIPCTNNNGRGEKKAAIKLRLERCE